MSSPPSSSVPPAAASRKAARRDDEKSGQEESSSKRPRRSPRLSKPAASSADLYPDALHSIFAFLSLEELASAASRVSRGWLSAAYSIRADRSLRLRSDDVLGFSSSPRLARVWLGDAHFIECVAAPSTQHKLHPSDVAEQPSRC